MAYLRGIKDSRVIAVQVHFIINIGHTNTENQTHKIDDDRDSPSLQG